MLAQWDWTGLFGGLISFAVVLYVQRTQRIRSTRGTTVSMIAFAALVAYVWAPIGFPNSDWSRAPLGTDVIRLIPFVNFDPALLQTQWLLVQVSMGAATFFLATLALYGDARRAAFAVIGIISFSATASAQAEPQRILFVGNSLTSHGPKADIDWHGNWGMAATSLDKDYVHVVTKALATKQGATPVIMVKNVADFERNHVGYDIAGKFADAAGFKADLVILWIGENVAALKTAEAQAKYQEQVTALLKTLKSNPNRWTVVTFHHPVFSTKSGRDNKLLRDHLKPVFDRRGVDLVLNNLTLD